MFRGQLIYNFAVITSPVFQVGIFFKREKKGTARLKDFSWQKQNKTFRKNISQWRLVIITKMAVVLTLKHRLQLKPLLTSM